MTEAGEEEGRTVTFDPEDAVVYTAAGLIVCGVVCMVVGYTVPRDYTFNPYARARDMEAIEIYYAHLSQSLDLTIVIGMGFIAIGGIILSSLITISVALNPRRSIRFLPSAVPLFLLGVGAMAPARALPPRPARPAVI